MADFNEVYKKIHDKYNIEMEQKRKKALLHSCILTGTIVFLIVFILLVFKVPIFIIGAVITCITIPLFIYNPFIKKFEKLYKHNIIYCLVNSYDSNLKFDENLGISHSIYDDAEFEHYDEFNSNDYISGNIDGIIKFELSDIRTVQVTHTKNGTTRTTIFEGLFSSSNLAKNLHSTIKIHTDKGFLGKFLENKQLMQMDSQDFEKLFDVYSNNKILTMRILTSDIMDFLINFKKQNKIKFEITLKNQKLYIRIHCKNMFEAEILNNSLKFETIHKYYNFLDFMCQLNKKIYNVVNEIDL